jgi:predicted transcriptional regulator
MTIVATSLKVPRALKARIDRLAKRTGVSAHALMLRALEEQLDAAERYQVFLDDAARADDAMQASGQGYPAEAVHAYLAAKVQRQRTQRPKPVRWRR